MKSSVLKMDRFPVGPSAGGRFWQTWLGCAVAALAMGFMASVPVRAQLVITASSSAPSAGVFLTQASENNASGLLAQTGTPASNFGFGQVFTAPSSSTLKSVTVRLDSATADNTSGILSEWSGQSLTFTVFSAASPSATTPGSSLFSAAAALPSLTAGDYLTFNFPSGVSLTSGSFYGFSIIPTSTVGPDPLFIAWSLSNPYAGGQSLFLSGASYTDTGSTGNDMVFFLSTSAIPEPSTYAAIFGALALGVAGLREHRRRRRSAA